MGSKISRCSRAACSISHKRPHIEIAIARERGCDAAAGGKKTFCVQKVFSPPHPLIFQKTYSGSAVRFVSDCSYCKSHQIQKQHRAFVQCCCFCNYLVPFPHNCAIGAGAIKFSCEAGKVFWKERGVWGERITFCSQKVSSFPGLERKRLSRA